MKTNTIILIAAVGAVAWYLMSRRSSDGSVTPAEITNDGGSLQTRVSGSVLKRQAIRSRTLPTYAPNYDPDAPSSGGVGANAATRMGA